MLKRILFAMILYLPVLVNAHTLTGKVVSIKDGDTVGLLVNRKIYTIRLSNIDAPEKKQDFGKASKRSLSNFIGGKTVKVTWFKKDRNGRLIGTIYHNGKNINLQQVKNGMAWVYRKYCDRSEYYEAEKYARENYLGIWSIRNPTPPWEYRHRGKSTSKPVSTKRYYSFQKEDGECWKRFCKEMTSCKEAYYYLKVCKRYRLDRDHDGVPCESICGHH